MGNMGRGALENPRHRAILESALNNALGGSNISNYATDNSSGSLAARERATGKFQFRSTYGGETFFAPGSAEPGLVPKWQAWQRHVAGGGGGPGPSGGTGGGADPNQQGHPYYLGGSVSLGGQQYHYGSGGMGAGAIPFGSYPINIGKGDIGPIGRRIGSVATLGGPSGTFTGGGHHWLGVQIHRAFSDRLDHLYTEGCFSVSASEWPAFRAKLLEENARHPEGLNLNVGHDGMASITPRGSSRELVPRHAADPAKSPANPTGASTIMQMGTGAPKIINEDDRRSIDRASSHRVQVEGSGKLTANINAPKGTDVSVDGGGIFKKVEVNRQVQMDRARGGPVGF